MCVCARARDAVELVRTKKLGHRWKWCVLGPQDGKWRAMVGSRASLATIAAVAEGSTARVEVNIMSNLWSTALQLVMRWMARRRDDVLILNRAHSATNRLMLALENV